MAGGAAALRLRAAAALIYQTAWMREFRLIFGASTAASAAVLAIFVGGLGLGGLVLGPRADRHPRPHPLLLAPRGDRGRVGGADAAGAGRRAVDLFLDGRHAAPRHGRRHHPAAAAQHGGARRADLRHGRHAAGRGARRRRAATTPAGRTSPRSTASTRSAPWSAAWRRRSTCSRSSARATPCGSPAALNAHRRRSRAPGRSELGRDRAGTARGAGRRRVRRRPGADLVPARRVRRGRASRSS